MSRLPPFDFKSALGEQSAAKAAKSANVGPPDPARLATLAALAVTSGTKTASDTRSNGASKTTRAASPIWTFEDCRDYFEERAAIREYDGGLSRSEAEAGALFDCAVRWRALNPLPASEPNTCVHCHKDGADTPVLARGGHAWLHRECWEPMNAARNELARQSVAALLNFVAQGVPTSALKGESQ